MAWNHPNQSVSGRPVRRADGPRRQVVHGLTAGGILVALSVGVWLWLGPQPPERKAAPSPRDLETAKRVPVQAAVVATNGQATVGGASARPTVQAKMTPRYASPTGTVELTKNVVAPAVLSNSFYNAISGGRPLFRRPIFARHSENALGGLLAATPGERFLPVDFDEEFNEDFKRSLEEEIVIAPDDSDEDIVLKEAVKKAKKQIAEAMKKGQTPAEIVADMRDEMNRVADYREALQEDFDKLKESATADKIEAYMKEANKLLDEFGAAHLDLPDDEVEMINERLEQNPEGDKEKEPTSLVIDLPGGKK